MSDCSLALSKHFHIYQVEFTPSKNTITKDTLLEQGTDVSFSLHAYIVLFQLEIKMSPVICC